MGPRRWHLRRRARGERTRTGRSRAALRAHRALVPRRLSRGVPHRRGSRPPALAGGIRAAGSLREQAHQRGEGCRPLGRFRRPPDGGAPARLRPVGPGPAGDRAALARPSARARSPASDRRRAGAHPVHLGQHGHASGRGDHRRQPGGQRRRDGQGAPPGRRRSRGLVAAAVSRHGPDRRVARARGLRRRLLAALAARVHAAACELDAGGFRGARHPHRRAELRLRAGGAQGLR